MSSAPTISRRALLAAPLLAASCARQAGTGYRGTAFVAAEESSSVVAVDLLAFSVKNRIELAAPPTELHLHSGTLFALTPKNSSLELIDPASRTRQRALRLNGEPITARSSAHGLWCLLRNPALLASSDGKSIPLPAAPVSFDLSPEAPLACVALADSRLAFVDLAQRKVELTAPLEGELGPVHFRSDGKAVFVAERAARRLTSFDTASRQPIAQLPLALSPDRFCVNADGGQLFLTGEGRDAVVIAYTFRHEIAQTSLTGRKPGAMAVSGRKNVPDDPQFLFVSNPQAGSVTVFDVMTQRVVAVTGVGMQPGPIVVTPDQQYALVLNTASADMAVIRIAAITGGKNRSAPLFTMIPVGAKPVSAVVVPA